MAALFTSGYPNPVEPRSFWRDAFAWRQSVTPRVLATIAAFGLFALVVGALHERYRWGSIEVSHLQYTGGVLVLLLVLRTNASYDRWWEARKLWGGIVNQSRNLAIGALAHGPPDPAWRRAIVRAVAAFPHASRLSLRGARPEPELLALLGDEGARVAAAKHLPNAVALHVSRLLAAGRRPDGLDPMAFLTLEGERIKLIDHVGACERILRTPMPLVHRIKLRRFILIYLTGLPFTFPGVGMVATSLITMLVAYPLIAIDRMGQEVESPFALESLSHLPLETICGTIQSNLEALLESDAGPPAG